MISITMYPGIDVSSNNLYETPALCRCFFVLFRANASFYYCFMDVIYVLGKGSRWQDNELRYSLRSLQLYLQHYDQVFIVGEFPDWLQNVVHIPHPNARSYVFKEANICDKILKACTDPRVSEDFIFLNDDFFLTADISCIGLPYWHKGPLAVSYEKKKGDSYGISLKQTIEYLERNHYPVNNFDCHAPIVYNKKKFIDAVAPIDWKKHFSCVIKSTYCNSQFIGGTFLKDVKISKPLKRKEISDLIVGRSFFSCGDRGLQGDLKDYLNELYPYKSKFEK
jgi:hypothetical protein